MRLWKKNVFTIFLLVQVMIVTALSGTTALAVTPRVMLTDYKLSATEIYPGDEFTLNFTLKNTSKNKIMNLRYEVQSEKGEFLPVDSVGTGYIAEMKGETEEEVSLKFSAVKKLEEKTYTLKIKTEYEDWNGKYKSDDTVYVPIKLKNEIVISDTYIAEEEIRLGDNIEVVSVLNNVGAADIYKVTASVEGDVMADANTFVGNVAAGKSANIDIITKATELYRSDRIDNKLIISYEDVNGKKFSQEVGLGKVEVIEQDYSDIIQVKPDTNRKVSDSEKLILIVLAVLVVAIFLIVKRQIKRRRLEKNFD